MNVSFNTLLEENSRKISLNLSDLTINKSTSSLPSTFPSFSSLQNKDSEEFIKENLQEAKNHEIKYKNNLEILLKQSKGTNYETIINKLLQEDEKENYENIDYDREEFHIQRNISSESHTNQLIHPSYNSQRNQNINQNNNFQSNDRNNNNSNNEKSNIQRSYSPSIKEQMNSIEHLAQPLPRNMWQVNSFNLFYLIFIF